MIRIGFFDTNLLINYSQVSIQCGMVERTIATRVLGIRCGSASQAGRMRRKFRILLNFFASLSFFLSLPLQRLGFLVREELFKIHQFPDPGRLQKLKIATHRSWMTPETDALCNLLRNAPLRNTPNFFYINHVVVTRPTFTLFFFLASGFHYRPTTDPSTFYTLG